MISGTTSSRSLQAEEEPERKVEGSGMSNEDENFEADRTLSVRLLYIGPKPLSLAV